MMLLVKKAFWLFLSKSEMIVRPELQKKNRINSRTWFTTPIAISSLANTGLEELQNEILLRLFGPPINLLLHPSLDHRSIEDAMFQMSINPA